MSAIRPACPVPGETDHPLAGVWRRSCSRWATSSACPGPGGCCSASPSPRASPSTASASGIIGMALAPLEGADVGRTAALCCCTTRTRPESATYPQSAAPTSPRLRRKLSPATRRRACPTTPQRPSRNSLAEFEAGQTIEAQVARDADKLETLLQAVEYQARGRHHAWQETSIAALRTDAAKQLAQAITAANPQWWSAFAASYRELRASALGRSRNPSDGRGCRVSQRVACCGQGDATPPAGTGGSRVGAEATFNGRAPGLTPILL